MLAISKVGQGLGLSIDVETGTIRNSTPFSP